MGSEGSLYLVIAPQVSKWSGFWSFCVFTNTSSISRVSLRLPLERA